jgi:hypothetical protein
LTELTELAEFSLGALRAFAVIIAAFSEPPPAAARGGFCL